MYPTVVVRKEMQVPLSGPAETQLCLLACWLACLLARLLVGALDEEDRVQREALGQTRSLRLQSGYE